MTIAALCARDVAILQRGATVQDAARLMRARHVGDVVIVGSADTGVPLGILTDRDIAIEVVGQGLAPAQVPVENAMSAPLLTLREDDGVLDSISRMAARGVHRAPVLDPAGRLAGLVSVDDLVPLLAQELGKLAVLIRRGQRREASRTEDIRKEELAT
jgi:CBS domain-containing protein